MMQSELWRVQGVKGVKKSMNNMQILRSAGSQRYDGEDRQFLNKVQRSGISLACARVYTQSWKYAWHKVGEVS